MVSRSSGRFRASPNPAAVSIRSLSICRASIAGSASQSCRPRAAFCPTTKPASPMSAARCCAACSETPGFEVIMSRIGKHPVAIPQGVEVQLSGQTLTVKGRLGALTTTVSGEVAATVENGAVTITPGSETKRARALWGTTRALVNNMVTGVANGFTRNLEINGVGYRAAVQGSNLNLQLGYSHDINYPIPPDVRITTERPTAITVSGADRQRVGQVASEIRAFRPPEPYKGKGIKYADETVRRKEGKKK